MKLIWAWNFLYWKSFVVVRFISFCHKVSTFNSHEIIHVIHLLFILFGKFCLLENWLSLGR